MTWNKGSPPQDLEPVYVVKFPDWKWPAIMRWDIYVDENDIPTPHLCLIDQEGDSYTDQEIPEDTIYIELPFF